LGNLGLAGWMASPLLKALLLFLSCKTLFQKHFYKNNQHKNCLNFKQEEGIILMTINGFGEKTILCF
jgi:hypothetical protein